MTEAPPTWLESCSAKGNPQNWTLQCDRLIANFSLSSDTSPKTQLDAWMVGVRAGYRGTVRERPSSAIFLGTKRATRMIEFLDVQSVPMVAGQLGAWSEADGLVRLVSCLSHRDLPPERCSFLRDWFAGHQALPAGVTQALDPNTLFDVKGWLANRGLALPSDCTRIRQKQGPYQLNCPSGSIVLVPMSAQGSIKNMPQMMKGLTDTLRHEYERTGGVVTDLPEACHDARGPVICSHQKIEMKSGTVEVLTAVLGSDPPVFIQCIYNSAPVAGVLPCPLTLDEGRTPGRSL